LLGLPFEAVKSIEKVHASSVPPSKTKLRFTLKYLDYLHVIQYLGTFKRITFKDINKFSCDNTSSQTMLIKRHGNEKETRVWTTNKNKFIYT
jgi:hypothetical protein